EVEIDPTTGALALMGYAAVDDCGKALNPMIVEGQTHGAIAQGLGQAMMEKAVFDASGGQLITGSFMDYAMPRADDLPVFKDAIHAVPAKTNPLGVKGAGEAGTTAAIAAPMNAGADAIPGGAGAHLDMPATAEKIWQACRQAPKKVAIRSGERSRLAPPLPAWRGEVGAKRRVRGSSQELRTWELPPPPPPPPPPRRGGHPRRRPHGGETEGARPPPPKGPGVVGRGPDPHSR